MIYLLIYLKTDVYQPEFIKTWPCARHQAIEFLKIWGGDLPSCWGLAGSLRSKQRMIMQSSHDALRRNLLSNWFLTLKMDALSTQLHEAPVFREETDVIYLHSCDLNTKHLLCNFYGWRWSSANSFLTVLWGRSVSICYRPTDEFWINSTEWDFNSLYRLLKELKRKLSLLFVGKGKLFIMKMFFEEFNLIFFTAESAWPVLKCNQGSGVLENFEVLNLSTLWSRKLRF